MEQNHEQRKLNSELERDVKLQEEDKSLLEIVADSSLDSLGLAGISAEEEPKYLASAISSPSLAMSSVSIVPADLSLHLNSSADKDNSKKVGNEENTGVYSTSSDEVLSAFNFAKKPGENDELYDTMPATPPNVPKYSLIFGQIYQDLIKRPNTFARILLEPQNKQLLQDFLDGFHGTKEIIPWTVKAGLKHWASKVPYADMDQLQQCSTRTFPYLKTTRPLSSLSDDDASDEDSMENLISAVKQNTEESSTLAKTVKSISSFMNFLCDLETGNGGSVSPSTSRQRNVRQAFQETFLDSFQSNTDQAFKDSGSTVPVQNHANLKRPSSVLYRMAGVVEGCFSLPKQETFTDQVLTPAELLTSNFLEESDVSNSIVLTSQQSYQRPGLMPYFNTPTVLPPKDGSTVVGESKITTHLKPEESKVEEQFTDGMIQNDENRNTAIDKDQSLDNLRTHIESDEVNKVDKALEQSLCNIKTNSTIAKSTEKGGCSHDFDKTTKKVARKIPHSVNMTSARDKSIIASNELSKSATTKIQGKTKGRIPLATSRKPDVGQNFNSKPQLSGASGRLAKFGFKAQSVAKQETTQAIKANNLEGQLLEPTMKHSGYVDMHRRKVAHKSVSNFGIDVHRPSKLRPPTACRK